MMMVDGWQPAMTMAKRWTTSLISLFVSDICKKNNKNTRREPTPFDLTVSRDAPKYHRRLWLDDLG